MCQLTLVHTNNLEYTKIIAAVLANVNSMDNQDGFGLLNVNSNTIYKTGNPAYIVSKISDHVTDNLVMFHVRKATISASGKREIKDENAHPFYKGNLILFHNGSLSLKEGTVPKEFESKTDSEFFTHVLADELAKEKDFKKAINNTMSKFTGKFAFLIKNKKELYVVRGKTAFLNQAKLFIGDEQIGFIVNTELTSLLIAMSILENIIPGIEAKYEEVEKESIYQYNPYTMELVKIGEIKENEKEYKSYISYIIDGSSKTPAYRYTSDEDDYFAKYYRTKTTIVYLSQEEVKKRITKIANTLQWEYHSVEKMLKDLYPNQTLFTKEEMDEFEVLMLG